MSYGIPKVYEWTKKKLVSVYFLEDLALRAPIFLTIPEPSSDLLISDGSFNKYSPFIGFTELRNCYWYWNPKQIQNPLIAIIGAPGGGKSELIKTMILRLKKKGFDKPILIVDPEGEYDVVVKQYGEGLVLNIGTEDYVNILDRPSKEMPYRLWVTKAVIPGILKALKVTEDQAPLMVRVLESVIFNVYENIYRFNPIDKSTWNKPDPTLSDVVKVLESDVKPYLEGRKKRDVLFRSKLTLLQRLKRWTQGEGTDFFARPSSVPLTELLKEPIVVFNIKYLPDDAKDVFTYFIFNYFYSLMEMSEPLPRFGLRLLLVFDEGWILLKKEQGKRESPLSILFRRARKYGFASIIATQRYKDISSDILPLVGTVVIFRIRDAEAVRALKESLQMPDRLAKKIPTLAQGEAIVSVAWRKMQYENASEPFVVRVLTEVKPVVELIMYRRKSAEIYRTIRAYR